MMLTVVALGGNALPRRGEPLDAAAQRANVKVAAESIAEIAREQVVLTHGNGPQVGLLVLQNEAYAEVDAYPSTSSVPRAKAWWATSSSRSSAGIFLAAGSLLTQVVVNSDDPAFDHPTKFVGPVYEADARRLAREEGWAVASDGDHWRRVVPSPELRHIVELETIRLLVDHDVTVTCAGGGGIPVVPDGAGGLRGVEGVIDKDLSAALAIELEAEALVLLTDVDAVYTAWGSAQQRAIRETTPAALRALELPAGSMGPKVEAVCRFVEAGGGFGAIGALDQAAEILRGEAGTVVRGGNR